MKQNAKENEWWYVVAPKQKKVKIMFGRKLMKTYSFQMDVPSRKVEKEFEYYDYGEWCVSARAGTYKKEVINYDEKVMNEIGQRALEYYLQNEQNPLTTKPQP